MNKGMVYLVGAGPGEAGLITRRGIECLEMAQVVVYDNLVNRSLLDYAPDDAEMIYVGKMANAHTMVQSEINRLLVERAEAGWTVVRLKGGDPFVFGRGGEEALELSAAGLPYEVVPGVTAGIAASAYAGIPVTHRGVSSAVTFITGHESPEREESGINWHCLAESDSTLVFYMGVKNLPSIVENLLKEGMSPDKPAALIENGTRPHQRVVRGTLKDIVERAEDAEIRAPAIIVIGKTVGLSPELEWFNKKPLAGKLFINTREDGEGLLKEELQELGASVHLFPVISVVRVPDNYRMEVAIKRLNSYDWTIFTSKNGVKYFFETLSDHNLDARALGSCKVAVIGPSTAVELSRYGVKADFVSQKYVAEELAAGLIKNGSISGKSLLLPRSSIGRKAFCELLRGGGGWVEDIPIYDTVIPGHSREQIERVEELLKENSEVWISFTSSSTVRHFFQLIDRELIAGNRAHIRFISIGPVTSATLKEFGFNYDLEAEEYTIEGMLKSIKEHFGID